MGKILYQKYEMIKQIGQGGMGKVFLAKDLNLDRLVAVKIHEKEEETALMEESPNKGKKQPEQDEARKIEKINLRREVELLKELKHPGLPAIYDFFREEKNDYLVMEYVDGIPLRQYLEKNGCVPEKLAVRWAIEMCDILEYLHGCNPAVIYRDLKPENIMIKQDGTLKLIDLGAALRFDCGIKKERLCMGTTGYSPKEQWKETKGDKTWDIYGLGAVLHEMLTGKNPMFPPYERRPLREYGRAFPRGLEQIVEKCTEENTQDRYQSMEQLRDALCHYHKRGRWSRSWWQIKRSAVRAILLLAVLAFILPLLKGVPENELPFPFLETPLFLLGTGVFLKWLFFKCSLYGGDHKEQFLCRQEKSIWLTEKKFSGLFVMLIFLTGCTLGTVFVAKPVYAGEVEERLWVEMRDEQGRKMLLKDGAVYMPKERVQFELPVNRLPEGELRVQLVAEGEEGIVYFSRVFLIKGKEEVR